MHVDTEFSVHFLMTGFCQNTQANFCLLSICNKRRVLLIFRRLGNHLLTIASYDVI